MQTIALIIEAKDYPAATGLAALFEQHSYRTQIVACEDSATAIEIAVRHADLLMPLVGENAAQSSDFQHLYNALVKTTAPFIPVVSAPVQDMIQHENAVIIGDNADDLAQTLLDAVERVLTLDKPQRSPSVHYPVLFGSILIAFAFVVIAGALHLTRTADSSIATLPTLVPTNTTAPTQQPTLPPTAVSVASNPSEIAADELAAFTPSTTDGPAPLLVEFVPDSVLDDANYRWDFDGDGVVDSESASASHSFERQGVYTVTLTVERGDARERATATILVRPSVSGASSASASLLAEFTLSTSQGELPLTVDFADASIGEVVSYEWDFEGDGIIDSEEANPTFTYISIGSYSPTLTVYDAEGNSDTVSSAVEVLLGETGPAGTRASFEVDATVGLSPLTVTFTDTSRGEIENYRWDFDSDGVIDSTESGNHRFVYETAGTYDATLTIRDSEGEIETVSQQIKIFETDNFGDINPDFTASPPRGVAPLTVRFTNQSAGDIASYAWDFDGDGVVDSTSANPAPYAYREAGVYDVSLVVTSAGGNEKVTGSSVIVEPPGLNGTTTIFADFNADTTSGKAPLTVNFSNQSTGSIASYAWDFDGDGTVDSTSAAGGAFTYQSAGTYDAILTLRGGDGDSTSVEVQIEVYDDESEALYADYNVRPSSGPAPLTVTFRNFSYGEIVAYAWDFDGDGTVDSTAARPPQQTFTQPGTYESSFTVTSSTGSSKRSTITIEVFGELNAAFDVDATSGTAPLVVSVTNTSEGDIASYAWDFDGDGTADSQAEMPDPITYSEAGVYPLELTVTDDDGNSDTATVTITVAEPTAEVTAEVTAEPTTPTAEATAEITPEVTAEPTDPTAEVTAEVTEDPTAEVTAEPTTPTAEPTAEPTTPTAEVTAEPTPPTVEVTAEPTEATPEPTTTTPEVTAEPTTPTAEPTAEATAPAPETTSEAVPQPTTPAAEVTAEPSQPDAPTPEATTEATADL